MNFNNMNKADEPDGLPPLVFKRYVAELMPVLFKVLYLSFAKGIF